MTDWKEIAARFADRSKDASLHQDALEYLSSLDDSQPVLVGCSGGADSVFLVLALLARLKEASSRLHILHFNHGLRDQASDEDEAFVNEMARSLGLAFHSRKAESPVPKDEHSLRAVRYGWMSQLYTELGAGGLCLGHHADDLVESQLMALFSGSGPAGMASPLPVKRFSDGQVRIRPLLPLKRRQIEKVLHSIEAPWREDESNTDTSYTRNWIRHQLVPNLLAGFPQDIYAASAHTQVLMKESVEALDDFLNSLSLGMGDPSQIDLSPLKNQPRALVRRAILAWWIRHHPDHRLEAPVLEGLLHSFLHLRKKSAWSIGDNAVLTLLPDAVLRIGAEHPTVPGEWACDASWHWAAGPLFLPDGSSLSARIVEIRGNEGFAWKSADPKAEAWIARWEPLIKVRQWQPGDRYRPLGAPGRRKLQDLFTDAKVSAEQKRILPVLLDGREEILWVPGFPPAEEVRIQPRCKSALKLTYHRH